MKLIDIKYSGRKAELIFEDRQLKMDIDLLFSLSLHEGQEYTEKQIDSFTRKQEEIECLQALLKALSYKALTSKQARDKLRAKEFSHSSIEKAIERCIEDGYISDDDYKESYINSMKGRYGFMKMKAALQLKGISIDRDDYQEDYLDALRLIEKKIGTDAQMDFQTKGKVYRYLSSKGYQGATIERAIREYETKI